MAAVLHIVTHDNILRSIWAKTAGIFLRFYNVFGVFLVDQGSDSDDLLEY